MHDPDDMLWYDEPASKRPDPEFAWLIKSACGRTRYWAPGKWVNNPNEAVRFSRAVDAERMNKMFDIRGIVREHGWG